MKALVLVDLQNVVCAGRAPSVCGAARIVRVVNRVPPHFSTCWSLPRLGIRLAAEVSPTIPASGLSI